MRRALCVLAALLVATELAAIDTSGMAVVGRSVHLTIWARDDRDYAGLLRTLEDAYARITAELNPGFRNNVSVYVYPDQMAFVKAVFGWNEIQMNVCGLADHVRSILYLTSTYDSCRPSDYMARMPVHELTHVIFPSQATWIREGVADYQAGILRDTGGGALPSALSDLRFSGSDEQRESAYGQAAGIVRYIVERLLHGERKGLVKYLGQHVTSDGRIVPDEAGFMAGWRQYMREVKS